MTAWGPMIDEFLKLLQAVEAGRKVDGKSSHAVTEQDVRRAFDLELRRSVHNAEAHFASEPDATCPGCMVVQELINTLREWLHAQGVDFPPDVLV